ncbi:MAG: hypothetical protein JW768_04115 [Chitinispirillaceae bacterium]|nr:hypothetical protein [Chitinispirillaceae bacterium]
MPRIRLAGCIGSIIVASAMMCPVFPIAGVGVHYGLDFSLNMEDATGERASLGNLELDVSTFGTRPSGYTKQTISGADLPVFIDRTGWERHWFNLGGKIYIDILPVINAVELSANYAMWQYRSSIIYPTSIIFDTANASPNADIKDIARIAYDTTNITLKDLDLDNPFLKNTPYAKLQFDLTVRKYLLELPPVVKILKIYGGAGMSLYFATPLLSAGFIDKTIGTTLETVDDPSQLQSAVFGQDSDAMAKLGKQFLKDLMTPHVGGHLDLGAMVKIPLMPVGIYIDGKYLLPFGKIDENVDLKPNGLLINSGIMFSL